MNFSKCIGLLGAAALLAVSSQTVTAGGVTTQQSQFSPVADTNSAAGKDADNTGRNVRDRNNSTLTPGDQGNSKEDIQTTRKVRRALTSNKQLSTTAKNIKIITLDGKTTLRGPVNSQQEKIDIEAAAQKVGVTNLDNQLEIKLNNH